MRAQPARAQVADADAALAAARVSMPSAGIRRVATKFVSTLLRRARAPSASRARAGVVVGEPVDVVVERVERGGGDHAGLPHARRRSRYLPSHARSISSARACDARRRAGSRAPSRSRAVTESARRAHSAGAQCRRRPAALKSRAPSRCSDQAALVRRVDRRAGTRRAARCARPSSSGACSRARRCRPARACAAPAPRCARA